MIFYPVGELHLCKQPSWGWDKISHSRRSKMSCSISNLLGLGASPRLWHPAVSWDSAEKTAEMAVPEFASRFATPRQKLNVLDDWNSSATAAIMWDAAWGYPNMRYIQYVLCVTLNSAFRCSLEHRRWIPKVECSWVMNLAFTWCFWFQIITFYWPSSSSQNHSDDLPSHGVLEVWD